MAAAASLDEQSQKLKCSYHSSPDAHCKAVGLHHAGQLGSLPRSRRESHMHACQRTGTDSHEQTYRMHAMHATA